ncbi:MAG: hypothetical protein ABR903_05845 [Thermodesulfovibrionales bacterium]|jgi:hypothetical protein
MAKTIKDKGSTKRLINPAAIMKTLGAEEAKGEIGMGRGPISLFSLRQFLVDRLRSTGGRPGLEGTRKKRNKIPLFSEDWEKLEELAKYYKETEGLNVSSGQIASALIHAEISKIDTSKIKMKSHSVSK